MQESKEALLQWIAAGGGFIHPALDIMADIGDGERGVVAVNQVQEGEQLAMLPMCLCLHTPTAAASTPQVQHACLYAVLPRREKVLFAYAC